MFCKKFKTRKKTRKWTIENLPSSTQNRTYHEVIQWLGAQLRTAAQDVPVLDNQLLNIEPLDVLGVMDAIEAHYQKLDDFGKWCISASIRNRRNIFVLCDFLQKINSQCS